MSNDQTRSGTLGLYKAFKILGYKPYHMVEVCAGGLDHFRMFHEYVRLSHATSDAVKPYGRPDFDKWFQGFDVSGGGDFTGAGVSADGRSRLSARSQAIQRARLSWTPILMTPMSNSSSQKGRLRLSPGQLTTRWESLLRRLTHSLWGSLNTLMPIIGRS